jgi:hypothetical protein
MSTCTCGVCKQATGCQPSVTLLNMHCAVLHQARRFTRRTSTAHALHCAVLPPCSQTDLLVLLLPLLQSLTLMEAEVHAHAACPHVSGWAHHHLLLCHLCQSWACGE